VTARRTSKLEQAMMRPIRYLRKRQVSIYNQDIFISLVNFLKFSALDEVNTARDLDPSSPPSVELECQWRFASKATQVEVMVCVKTYPHRILTIKTGTNANSSFCKVAPCLPQTSTRLALLFRPAAREQKYLDPILLSQLPLLQ
jgi:hypothetical protein